MKAKNNQIRLRIDFEDSPLIDQNKVIKSPADIDDMITDVKKKLYGK